MPTSALISFAQAAALLQPILGELSAGGILTDWRRREPRYHKRVVTKPRFVRRKGRVKYPRAEIERVIVELMALKARAGSI